MAQRPRSHQLEDLSRNRFREMMPLHWVVRDRSHDYGVDFEVEIFSPEGEATGLIFLAQLKATDAASAADRLAFSKSKLAYLNSLDLPVAVFRYVSTTDNWRWCWTFEANIPNAQRRSNVLTIRFNPEHAWHDQSLSDIEHTLRVGRALKSAHPQLRVALVRAGPAGSVHMQFAIDDAIAAIIRDLPCLVRDRSTVDGLVVEVAYRAPGLRISLNRFAEVEISEPNRDALKAALLYSIIAILRTSGLHAHSEAAARVALREGLTTHLRPLAAHAVAALASAPMEACDLAISNGIQREQDAAWVTAYHLLITAPAAKELKSKALEQLNNASLAHARNAGEIQGQAMIHNNLAQMFANISGNEREALHHLNAARRLRPAYMRTDYFLVDIGRVLFGGGRYRGAALFYRAAYELRPDSRVRLFLADALMFAGMVGEAGRHFRALQSEVDEGELAEVGLKAMLCETMEAEFMCSIVPTRTAAGNARIRGLVGSDLENSTLLSEVTKSHDAFNLVANFNLGIISSRSGDSNEAVVRFLICAFKRSGDIEAWRNAVLLSINLKDPLVAAAIVECAMRNGGPAVRDAVRLELINQVDNEEAIRALDHTMTVAMELACKKEPGVLFRMYGAEGEQLMLTFSLG